jgi:hypothetical protein
VSLPCSRSDGWSLANIQFLIRSPSRNTRIRGKVSPNRENSFEWKLLNYLAAALFSHASSLHHVRGVSLLSPNRIRNLELTRAFAPLEDLANFGLDALFIVTDAAASALPPKFLSPAPNSQNGNVSLNWDATGKVFQHHKTSDAFGSYLPVTPIIVETNFTDFGVLTNNTKSFYRLRQW